MRLELGTFPVSDVQLGNEARWSDGLLTVDEGGILNAIKQDPRILSANLELVKPGESLRIASVRDVIEPRLKVSGPGVVYPGMFGRPVTTVGQGRTHRLAGTTVIEVAEVEFYHGNDAWLDSFIDMSGTGAVAPYCDMPNVCVVVEVDKSLEIEDQNEAATRAALLASDMVAEATRDLTPPELKIYELTETPPDMPKVAYIICLRSPQHYADSVYAHWTSIYGLSRQTTPWVLHPNEIIDGAISGRGSWELINNPVVEDMYEAHGKEFAFAGIIAARTRWSAQNEKDITSQQCAKIAAMLGASGVIITYDAGGNDFMETIRTVQACENAGIKTVFASGEEPPSTGGPPLLEPLPEACAIVSLGQGGGGPGSGSASPLAGRQPLLAVDKLIGQKTVVADPSQRQHILPTDGPMPSARWSDHYGFGRSSAFEY